MFDGEIKLYIKPFFTELRCITFNTEGKYEALNQYETVLGEINVEGRILPLLYVWLLSLQFLLLGIQAKKSRREITAKC